MRRSRERDRVRHGDKLDGGSGDFHYLIGGGDLGGYTDESQLLEDTQGVSGPNSTTMMNEDLDSGLFYPSQFSQREKEQQQSTPSGGERTISRINSCQALDRLNTKIACTKESIRKEQTSRDGEWRVERRGIVSVI